MPDQTAHKVGLQGSLLGQLLLGYSTLFTVESATSAGDPALGMTFAKREVASCAELVKAPIVLQPAIDALALSQRFTVAIPEGTALIGIRVGAENPNEPARISIAISAELVKLVERLASSTPSGERSVAVTVVAPVASPPELCTPNMARNMLMELVAGLFLGITQAALSEATDTSIRNVNDVARVTGHSLVESIPFDAGAAQGPIVMDGDRHSARAEAYRRLRTNMQFLSVGGTYHAAMITSSVPGEGKSTVRVNKGVALAESAQQALLVDVHRRRPHIAHYTGLEGAVGLTTVLAGRAAVQDVMQVYGNSESHVLTSRQSSPKPSELLASNTMKNPLHWTSEQYHIVIIDSASLLPVSDLVVPAERVGGVLLLVASGEVIRPRLAAPEGVEAVSGNIMGLVLNKDLEERTADLSCRDRDDATLEGNQTERPLYPKAARRAIDSVTKDVA